jgi:hypothetical protein
LGKAFGVLAASGDDDADYRNAAARMASPSIR